MTDFRAGQEVTISVKALYDSGIPLEYGSIVLDHDENRKPMYYDLYNEDGELACCDGETCRIEQVGVDLITLVNNDGESTVYLTLTRPEAEIAVFQNRQNALNEWLCADIEEIIDMPECP